jgi:hypothetical protein
MLQILIWAVCVLIIAVAYCAEQLTRLVAQEKGSTTSGTIFFVVMFILAAGLVYLSIKQGEPIEKLMNFLP